MLPLVGSTMWVRMCTTVQITSTNSDFVYTLYTYFLVLFLLAPESSRSLIPCLAFTNLANEADSDSDKVQLSLQASGGDRDSSGAARVSWNSVISGLPVWKRSGWLLGCSPKVAMARLAALLLLLPMLFEGVFSISFFLPVNSRKCLREEIHKDVLVTGEYEIAEQANTKTNLKVSADMRVSP